MRTLSDIILINAYKVLKANENWIDLIKSLDKY